LSCAEDPAAAFRVPEAGARARVTDDMRLDSMPDVDMDVVINGKVTIHNAFLDRRFRP